MVIGNRRSIPVWRNNTLYFSNAIVIEEYLLSCECLDSFMARFIKLYFLFRFRRKMNP